MTTALPTDTDRERDELTAKWEAGTLTSRERRRLIALERAEGARG